MPKVHVAGGAQWSHRRRSHPRSDVEQAHLISPFRRTHLCPGQDCRLVGSAQRTWGDFDPFKIYDSEAVRENNGARGYPPRDGLRHRHFQNPRPPLLKWFGRFSLLKVHHGRPRKPVLPSLVELQIMPFGDLDAVVRQQQRNVLQRRAGIELLDGKCMPQHVGVRPQLFAIALQIRRRINVFQASPPFVSKFCPVTFVIL